MKVVAPRAPYGSLVVSCTDIPSSHGFAGVSLFTMGAGVTAGRDDTAWVTCLDMAAQQAWGTRLSP